MERKMINDTQLDDVVGGSIMFSDDHTTCGRNCTNKYKVLNYSAVLQYIGKNKMDMTEKEMLQNMVAAGLLAKL